MQRVELGVGDLGSVVDVVALFVVADRVAELASRRCRRMQGRTQVVDRPRGRQPCADRQRSREQHVVGQRHSASRSGPGGKRARCRLARVGELDARGRRRSRSTRCSRRAARMSSRPLLVGDVARRATMSRDERVARSAPPRSQQVDDRQRDLAFAQVAADRLAERLGVAGEVEQVVDQLERDAEVEAVLAQRLSAARASTSPSMPPICAQPPNRYAVLRRMMSKCSSSVMSTSPFLVSW